MPTNCLFGPSSEMCFLVVKETRQYLLLDSIAKAMIRVRAASAARCHYTIALAVHLVCVVVDFNFGLLAPGWSCLVSFALLKLLVAIGISLASTSWISFTSSRVSWR
jgi:hypothetical protein